jgi:branched-chain amino acid transport system substrate-binding protein
MLLPGIKISTGPSDYAPIKQMQLMKFNGRSWDLFGPVLSAESS